MLKLIVSPFITTSIWIPGAFTPGSYSVCHFYLLFNGFIVFQLIKEGQFPQLLGHKKNHYKSINLGVSQKGEKKNISDAEFSVLNFYFYH